MVTEAKTAVESVGVAGQLGLDAKLFIAQLVNFGVVVFVVWRWIYTPLLKILDERAKKIEQGLKDAEIAAAAKGKAEEEMSVIVAEARRRAKEIIDEAVVMAEKDRQETTRKAKTEVEKIVGQGREQLRQEKEKMVGEIKSEMADLLAAATERVIKEKLDPKKDAQLIREALTDIRV